MSELTARDLLIQEIADLKEQLRRRESALKVLDKERLMSHASSGTYRFVDMRPLDAIVIYLREMGVPQTREAITEALIEGGITIGKKRGEHNIRISIDLNLSTGNLIEVDGKIGLPEWQSHTNEELV